MIWIDAIRSSRFITGITGITGTTGITAPTITPSFLIRTPCIGDPVVCEIRSRSKSNHLIALPLIAIPTQALFPHLTFVANRVNGASYYPRTVRRCIPRQRPMHGYRLHIAFSTRGAFLLFAPADYQRKMAVVGISGA